LIKNESIENVPTVSDQPATRGSLASSVAKTAQWSNKNSCRIQKNPMDQQGYNMQHKVQSIRALKDHVLVADMNFAARKLSGGIQLLDDDMSYRRCIRPRWARVYATGPEQKDVQVGQWVLVSPRSLDTEEST
jgi:hypothetical protein